MKEPGLHRQHELKRLSHITMSYANELGYLYVLQEYRGFNLAKTACKILIDHKKYENTFATIRMSNDASIKLFESLGFRQHGMIWQSEVDENQHVGLFIKFV